MLKYTFFVGFHLCFQFQFNSDEWGLSFRRELVTPITYFKLSIGHESNSYDRSRQIRADTDWINRTQLFTAKSNSFKILKMPSPYSDHCFNYPDIGLRDSDDAIATRDSNQTHVSPLKVVRETDVKFMNSSTKWTMTIKPGDDFKPDCNQRLFLTRLRTTEPGYRKSSILFVPDTDVSFSVISKPKIDNIDYVTYILGALGSWIGFSFIGINPIPHLLQMPREASVTPINHSICKLRFQQLKLDSIKDRKEINAHKQTIAQIISYLESQANQS